LDVQYSFPYAKLLESQSTLVDFDLFVRRRLLPRIDLEKIKLSRGLTADTAIPIAAGECLQRDLNSVSDGRGKVSVCSLMWAASFVDLTDPSACAIWRTAKA